MEFMKIHIFKLSDNSKISWFDVTKVEALNGFERVCKISVGTFWEKKRKILNKNDGEIRNLNKIKGFCIWGKFSEKTENTI